MSDASKKPTRRAIQHADAAQRAQRAWGLREAGSTWDQIAEAIGVHDGATAIRCVRSYFGELPQPARDDLRELWRTRLERLYALADRDAEASRPGALRAGVAIAQRAAALDALDVPTVTLLASPSAAEFDQVIGQLIAARGISATVEADIFLDTIDVEDDVDEP